MVIALVDANHFYVSCERVFRPDLEGRSVVVLSNNDSCVVARSLEVKAPEVAMGTPWFQLHELANREGILALSSNCMPLCLGGRRPAGQASDGDLDQVNTSFCSGTLQPGIVGSREARGWAMKLGNKSPDYTTLWSELAIAKLE
jgi:nucleotidyltransferase/DNA polymerase involved in DNA repair